MKVDILLFGVSRDIVGQSRLELTLKAGTDVKNLKSILKDRYPNLPMFMLAINMSYASDNTIINNNDELAIIPPTSGG